MRHRSESLLVAINTDNAHAHLWMETLHIFKPLLIYMHMYTYVYKWKRSLSGSLSGIVGSRGQPMVHTSPEFYVFWMIRD